MVKDRSCRYSYYLKFCYVENVPSMMMNGNKLLVYVQWLLPAKFLQKKKRKKRLTTTNARRIPFVSWENYQNHNEGNNIQSKKATRLLTLNYGMVSNQMKDETEDPTGSFAS